MKYPTLDINIICCHPYDIYYPWWIWRMKHDKLKYRRLYVAMTQQITSRNYLLDLNESLPILSTYIATGYEDDGKDWRNAALNFVLNLDDSRSEWVLFLEQDFLYNDRFWGEIINLAQKFDVIGFGDGDRFHPAFLLVKRKILDQTTKDFAVKRDVGDHFYKLSLQLKQRGKWVDFSNTDHVSDNFKVNWFHLAGLTQNYRLTDNWYEPITFYTYNHWSMKIKNIPPSWLEICQQMEDKLDAQKQYSNLFVERLMKEAT